MTPLFTWPSPIRAVVFDIGETLVDESRTYWAWADWLGVPRLSFAAVMGAVIAAGEDHREVFQRLRPGFDLDAERAARAALGRPETFDATDLYPDVLPTLAALRAAGLRVCLAGNQPGHAAVIVRELFAEKVDAIGTASDWGVEKPDPEFYRRAVAAVGCAPDEILHVGDRLDNDVVPAAAAGMRTALLRRGPWGHIHWTSPAASPGAPTAPDLRLTSLAELPALLAGSPVPGNPSPGTR